MLERRVIRIDGIVQGVGFRPFVHRLAMQYTLAGSVRNQSGAVLIDVEGESSAVQAFVEDIVARPPPLAQIQTVTSERHDLAGMQGFQILESDSGQTSRVFVSPDVATCAACLAELLDPADRRAHYPFLNCTNCGPRLTIVTGAPYDRRNTTMRSFALCSACRAEYNDPADRRFHAQPTACAACGPTLRLVRSPDEAPGAVISGGDALRAFGDALLSGQIGALKGLGGYHLVCDARNEATVRELRRRKQRDEKPLAVMVNDLSAVAALCECDDAERDLLSSWRCPIVLLRKRSARDIVPESHIADSVAPRNPFLGIMLPYTPLHHLLLRQLRVPLVMTSGNQSDEPIACDERDALERLHGIADLFLTHDRPIHVRCDDSVIRVVDSVELPVRRSRGYAPQPIHLPLACPRPMLAVGGQLKATFALGCERQAFLSHHLGDLDHFAAYQAFERDIGLYERLFEVQPEVLVHDLHPDYVSTHYAVTRANSAESPLERVPVQHHHAHLASCMAEHGLSEPVIGVIFDGSGYGTDGTIWGGEFLVGDYGSFERAAHLRGVALPGGEQAIREPWRLAVAHLRDAESDDALLAARVPKVALRAVERMLDRRINAPLASSAGRLFDAVAALAGVRDRVSYEGQAAIELEWLATGVAAEGTYRLDLIEEMAPGGPPTLVVDTRPLIRAVAADAGRSVPSGTIARRFHSTLVALIADVCLRIRQRTGLATVVLSGGVFLNVLLTRETMSRLQGEGFAVYRQRLVPPNDGGLSLGQLAIAARQVERGEQLK